MSKLNTLKTLFIATTLSTSTSTIITLSILFELSIQTPHITSSFSIRYFIFLNTFQTHLRVAQKTIFFTGNTLIVFRKVFLFTFLASPLLCKNKIIKTTQTIILKTPFASFTRLITKNTLS